MQDHVAYTVLKLDSEGDQDAMTSMRLMDPLAEEDIASLDFQCTESFNKRDSFGGRTSYSQSQL